MFLYYQQLMGTQQLQTHQYKQENYQLLSYPRVCPHISQYFNPPISINPPSNQHIIIIPINMSKYLFVLLFALFCLSSAAFKAADCPKTLEVKCTDDIRAGFDICEEAAKEKGSDTDIDIQCIKYFHSMTVDCWPCICYVAKQDNIKVKGC